MFFILKSVADSRLAILVLSFAISALVFGAGTTAYAENYGIVLDNTCLTLLKNNITTDCPTYEDVITLFPDTSNRKITGEFGYNHGIFQRLPTKLHDSFNYYSTISDPVLFIDPPSEYKNKINLIEIKANLKEYKLPDDKSYNSAEHTLTLGVGRYMATCHRAYVDAKDWIFLVGDTMKHMEAGCTPGSTTFVSQFTTQLNKTKHDITTSYKWKLEQWQKQSIEKCGKRTCFYDREQPIVP